MTDAATSFAPATPLRLALILSTVLAFVLPLAEIPAAPAPDLPPILTTVDQIRRSPMEEAAKGYPVRLRGVVTYRAKGHSLMFLQDSTGGIYVHPDSLPPELSSCVAGTEIELEGKTMAERFAPFVEGTGGHLIGLARLPDPMWLSADQLSDPRHDSQWLELGGTVRSVRTQAGTTEVEHETTLSIGADAGRFTAVIFGNEALNPAFTNLVGASIRVRGVYGSIFNERRQLVGMKLFVSSMRHITVEKPATDDPFTSAARPVASLMQFEAGSKSPSRVRVHGTVTLLAENRFFLEDPSGGVQIQTVGPCRLQPGELVDAVGFPTWGYCKPILEDAQVKVVGRTNLAEAPTITAAQALSGDFCFRRVRIDALVIQASQRAEQPLWILQSEDEVFPTRFNSKKNIPRQTAKEGALVQGTGICINQARATPGAETLGSDQNEVRRKTVFYLLMDSPADIRILRSPSWWTATRLIGVMSVLGAALLAGGLWVVLLRRQIAAKTTIIREQINREAIHHERERIARELHDTLEQEMTGIAMQLDAAGAILGQNQEPAKNAIETARLLLDRSRDEARHSIWELRNPVLEQGGLKAALRELVDSFQNSGNAKMELKLSGQPFRLPIQSESHLVRIVHEGVTNAIKHSNASQIDVQLSFSTDAVAVGVRDNGRGFDPTVNGKITRRQFGLLGMKERAARLQGQLCVNSAPAQGTAISITVRRPKSE